MAFLLPAVGAWALPCPHLQHLSCRCHSPALRLHRKASPSSRLLVSAEAPARPQRPASRGGRSGSSSGGGNRGRGGGGGGLRGGGGGRGSFSGRNTNSSNQGGRSGFSPNTGSRGGSRGGRGGRGGRGASTTVGDFIANEDIMANEVRLIGVDKEMIGVVSLNEALNMADDNDTDVVLISPNAEPPVCRLVDVSKYKYELEKNEKEAKRKMRETRQDLKELKLRPNTDVHDYQVRLRSAEKFIANGDKVKLTLQFKGREMQFQQIGRDMFSRFVSDLEGKATPQSDPSMVGKTMTMILQPQKK